MLLQLTRSAATTRLTLTTAKDCDVVTNQYEGTVNLAHVQVKETRLSPIADGRVIASTIASQLCDNCRRPRVINYT